VGSTINLHSCVYSGLLPGEAATVPHQLHKRGQLYGASLFDRANLHDCLMEVPCWVRELARSLSLICS
jgi:hypothetical protein